MVITLTSHPRSGLSKEEQLHLGGEIRRQVDELLNMKKDGLIDGWVMRRFGDITHTTIFYTRTSRLLQRKVFGWQKNISDTLGDKRRVFKVTESSDGQEIVVFPNGSVLYDRDTIANKANTVGGKRFRITENELNILKNGDIKSVLAYTRKIYQYTSSPDE